MEAPAPLPAEQHTSGDGYLTPTRRTSYRYGSPSTSSAYRPAPPVPAQPNQPSSSGAERCESRDQPSAPPSAWDAILGPALQSRPSEQEPELLTLDAFRSHPETPSFKPDYNQPSYRPSGDPAKRNLFPEPAGRRQLSPDTRRKVESLGTPYAVQDDDRASVAGQDRPGAQPQRYLSAKTSAPFFAAALFDANMPVVFPEEDSPGDQELGMASRAPEKRSPRPYIPVVKSLQNYIKKLRGTCNIPKLKWPASSFPAPPEADKEFFQATEVPKSCWMQMKDDAYSWCQPEKNPPAGVEGASSTSTKPVSSKPHKIFPWNESRDTELYDLEVLARDGLRLANASIIAYAHLLNGILDPNRLMSETAKQHTLFTVNDFVHVAAEQFARIAQRIALHRKLNVIRSLNVADQSHLMNTPMSHDIFGGKWPELQAEELERRKKKAEKEKERRARQAAAAAAARPKSFKDNAPAQKRANQPPPAPAKKKENQQQRNPQPKDKKKDDRDGPRRDKRGGGGGGGNRRK